MGSERPKLGSERPSLGSERGGRRKQIGKIALCGIIGHLPLLGRCPKVKVNEYGNAKNEEKTIKNADIFVKLVLQCPFESKFIF